MNRVQALLENSSFIHCRFAPSLHPVVDMKGLGDIYKYVVFIDIIVSSTNQDRYGSRLIIQAAEYLHARNKSLPGRLLPGRHDGYRNIRLCGRFR